MGKVLLFMSKQSQDNLKEAVKSTAMVHLAHTYYGIPRRGHDPLERLVRLWPRIPESLKNELRHILAPAFRKKALIVKDEKLIQEVDDYLTEFEWRNEEKKRAREELVKKLTAARVKVLLLEKAKRFLISRLTLLLDQRARQIWVSSRPPIRPRNTC